MSRPRIAVVEDNDDNRLLLRTLLEDDYEVDEYASGRAALAGLAEQVPHLILMDVSLPEIDGPEVLATLRRDARFDDVPAIVLTAHAMVGDRERLLARGFDEYVSKPIVDEVEFMRLITELLERGR